MENVSRNFKSMSYETYIGYVLIIFHPVYHVYVPSFSNTAMKAKGSQIHCKLRESPMLP